MKRTAGRVIRGLLIAALLCVFLFASGKIYRQLSEERQAKEIFRELSETVRAAEAQPVQTKPDPAGRQPDAPEILPQYAALYALNNDFFGWVRIDGTPIDYPVMYTPKDPEHYLRRGFDGEPLYCGVPFVDGGCAPDGSYYLIHGHHMKNDTMFGTLPKYLSYSYWQEHRTVSFNTLKETREYEILAAFRTGALEGEEDDSFPYLDYTELSDPETFATFLAGVRGMALYDTGVTAEWGDELLTLSTCSYHTENGRFAVVARRIR